MYTKMIMEMAGADCNAERAREIEMHIRFNFMPTLDHLTKDDIRALVESAIAEMES